MKILNKSSFTARLQKNENIERSFLREFVWSGEHLPGFFALPWVVSPTIREAMRQFGMRTVAIS